MLAKFNMNKKKSKTNHMRHHTHDTATTAAPASFRSFAWALQIFGAKRATEQLPPPWWWFATRHTSHIVICARVQEHGPTRTERGPGGRSDLRIVFL